jgi:hypothetical protein
MKEHPITQGYMLISNLNKEDERVEALYLRRDGDGTLLNLNYNKVIASTFKAHLERISEQSAGMEWVVAEPACILRLMRAAAEKDPTLYVSIIEDQHFTPEPTEPGLVY